MAVVIYISSSIVTSNPIPFFRVNINWIFAVAFARTRYFCVLFSHLIVSVIYYDSNSHSDLIRLILAEHIASISHTFHTSHLIFIVLHCIALHLTIFGALCDNDSNSNSDSDSDSDRDIQYNYKCCRCSCSVLFMSVCRVVWCGVE